MEQMYKMALDPRIFPDQRLLSIMQGRDQSLPMAIAMAAKQQRDKLKTAETGAAAQQGAKQPTVKDKMLAQDLVQMPDVDAMGNVTGYADGGLASLPAENMQGMDEVHMAAGGIVAFEDNQNQPVKLGMDGDAAPLTEEQMIQAASGRGLKKSPEEIKKALQEQKAGISSILSAPGNAIQSFKDWMYSDPQSKILAKAQSGRLTAADLEPRPNASNLKGWDDGTANTGTPLANNTYAPALGLTAEQQALINAKNANNPIKPGPGAPPAAAPGATPAGIGEPPKRIDRFAGLGETQASFDKKIAEEKNMGIAELFMNAGAAIGQHVGPIGAALAKGIGAGLPSLTASRKTIRELEKNRQDYQFNTAKAQSALDQGDEELFLKHKELADKNAYHMGLLAVEKSKAGTYAASVGSKEDIAAQRSHTAIMATAEKLLEKNMKYNLPSTSAADKQAMLQDAINSATAMYNSAIAATSSAKGFKYLGKET
jgi:hypothetical protein